MVASKLLFLDLDGVLADFVGGAAAWHRKPHPYDKEENLGKWGVAEMFGLTGNQFWSSLDYDFWSGLDQTPEFDSIVKQSFAAFPPEQIYICSSASLRSGCCDGKREWVSRNVPALLRNHLIFTSEKHLLAAPNRILVDDYDYNIQRWQEGGGITVRVNRPWNSGHSLAETFSGDYALFAEEVT